MHELTSADVLRGSVPIRRIAGALGAAVLVASCGGATTTSAPTGAGQTTGAGGAQITVTETDFKIEPNPTTAAPGPVTFKISNSASQVHEFVVVKTETPGDQLPLASGGVEVAEDAAGLTVVDEVEDLAAGASADLDVTLDAGHYVLLCNVAGHYSLGMHTDFTVGP